MRNHSFRDALDACHYFDIRLIVLNGLLSEMIKTVNQLTLTKKFEEFEREIKVRPI